MLGILSPFDQTILSSSPLFFRDICFEKIMKVENPMGNPRPVSKIPKTLW